MKVWFSKKGNILTLLLLAFVLWKQIPMLLGNMEMEGKEIESKDYALVIESNTMTTFPPVSGNTIAIFWATWCAPCKIEMERLRKSVENDKIPRGAIFAINPFEEPQDTVKFIKENNFPFTFIHAPEIARVLDVKATPSTVFIKNGKVDSMSSGLSFVGIWKAESFLGTK